MIYDCVIFFKEYDILELRLNILKDYVDYFVITESNLTHSGKSKPYYFEENKEYFYNIIPKEKIIHQKIEGDINVDSWSREFHQRDNMIPKSIVDDDLIITSDVDEIINPNILKNNFEKNTIYTCLQNFYYYKLNNFINSNWYGSIICFGDV